jgi:hypothetical protein
MKRKCAHRFRTVRKRNGLFNGLYICRKCGKVQRALEALLWRRKGDTYE